MMLLRQRFASTEAKRCLQQRSSSFCSILFGNPLLQPQQERVQKRRQKKWTCFHNKIQCNTSLSFRSFFSSFTFAGLRQLSDILHTDKIKGKSDEQIAALWTEYHGEKDNVMGFALTGAEATTILERAQKCAFYIHPVFVEKGHFLLVSQFQEPHHFLLTHLAEYQRDLNAATPWITVTIFTLPNNNNNNNNNNHAPTLGLVRADRVKTTTDAAAVADNFSSDSVVRSLVEQYLNDEAYAAVEQFTTQPDSFDWEAYVARMRRQQQQQEQQR